ncbi:MAG: HlyD family efflux transporter periplasmic adaptor subunit [Elusimicrobiales bacterium]|nr:HlyD family efflux transporter periplasmic adaptor subunit [Elusimicrobiales bacterium]
MKKFFSRHWKKLVFIAIAAGTTVALWHFFVKPLIAKIKGETISQRDIAEAKKGNVELIFSAAGTITAKQDIKISSKPSGILKAIYVKEGDHVKKGQKLGLIKPGRNEFEDYKPMPILSEAEGTVIKCINSDDYRKDLADKDLSLPRLGTFLQGTYDNASNASCFLRVVNMDTLLIPAYVSEREIMKLKKGMPADINISSLEGKSRRMKGEISYLSTQSEVTGRWGDSSGFLVITELKNTEHKILLGISAEINVVIDKRENVLTVPANAIFEKGGKSYVFKYLGDNKTEKTEVELGLSSESLVEIKKGLAEKDKVLTALPYGESW